MRKILPIQLKKPYSFKLSLHEGGIYSIDHYEFGKTVFGNQILMDMGRITEIALTNSESRIEAILNNSEPNWTPQKDLYHYSKSGKILLRSQIDCYHPNLNNKYFDIKTRATQPIRLNVTKHEKFSGRKLNINGSSYSFQREYYDMIRSPMLKNIFQVRIGNMDGIFVIWHNLNEMLGFEYLSRDEMELNIFESKSMADMTFDVCSNLVSELVMFLRKRFESQEMIVTVQSEKSNPSVMNIIVELPDKNLYVFKLNLVVFIGDKALKGPFVIDKEHESDFKVCHKLWEIKVSQKEMRQAYEKMVDICYIRI